VTVKVDADILDWMAARGENVSQEINGLMRFFMETQIIKESQFDPDAWEPGEMQAPPPPAP
jgi:hypothetical protein